MKGELKEKIKQTARLQFSSVTSLLDDLEQIISVSSICKDINKDT